jgi:membrane protein YqaA with SNARE-associated domain
MENLSEKTKKESTDNQKGFRGYIWNWAHKHAGSRKAQWWLSIFSFIEASFSPLPPSTLMVAIIATGQRHRWVYYAGLTTVTSVLGGLFGYLIGDVFYSTFGQVIIAKYHLADEIARIGVWFEKNAFWTILVAAFTPIPYKAFTISAGFFNINVFLFATASLIGRGIRYFILAYIAYLFGEHATGIFFKYFNLILVVLLLSIASILLLAFV